jgi:hypothetical protein
VPLAVVFDRPTIRGQDAYIHAIHRVVQPAPIDTGRDGQEVITL